MKKIFILIFSLNFSFFCQKGHTLISKYKGIIAGQKNQHLPFRPEALNVESVCGSVPNALPDIQTFKTYYDRVVPFGQEIRRDVFFQTEHIQNLLKNGLVLLPNLPNL